MDLDVLFEGCTKWKWIAVVNLLIFVFCFAISCWYLRGRLQNDVQTFKFSIMLAGMNIQLDLLKIQELSSGEKAGDSSEKGDTFFKTKSAPLGGIINRWFFLFTDEFSI